MAHIRGMKAFSLSKCLSKVAIRECNRRCLTTVTRATVAGSKSGVASALWQRPDVFQHHPLSLTPSRLYSSLEDQEPVYVCDDVSFEQVREGMRAGTMSFLDVRKSYEIQESGRIGNAYNIAVEELMEALALKDEAFTKKYGFSKKDLKRHQVVVYCRSGKRAITACQILDTYGLKNVKRYPGSWVEWEELYDPVSH